MRLSELVELGVLARSELYRDLLHPAGVEYEIAIGMRTGRGEVVVVALGRTECDFSERDRDVLDVAHPGLEGAMQTAQVRERLDRVLAADAMPGTAGGAPGRIWPRSCSPAAMRSAGSQSTSGG